jgi:vancomycin resistance protein VanJ
MMNWLRRGTALLALLHPFTLVVAYLLLRFVGERFWVTSVFLYLPRFPALLPVPVLTVALFATGQRRLLWTQVVGLLVALFPIMGFVVSTPSLGASAGPKLRVLTFNVNAGASGYDTVAKAILAESPDVVLVQEATRDPASLVAALAPHYAHVETSTQFVLASKFPVVSTTDPPRIPYLGRLRSPRFLRHELDTPLGRVVVYAVHPLSPRGGFITLRGRGVRRELLSGRLLSAQNAWELREDNALRSLQVKAFTEMADAEHAPVVIAGDTNLTAASPLLALLSRYQDGFSEVGFGFGFTFPSKRPWMRLDRIFASHELRFTSFAVGCDGTSDHRCVVADLVRR